jgi:drug/metabolite transporter (DMT)-like permease
MTSPRHFTYFMLLGLFWGVSPSFYKLLANINMHWSHTIFVTGIGVGVVMWLISAWRSGTFLLDASILRYGAGCAFLMNVPFAINLFLARYVPPTELSIVITTSPFFSYLLALATGWESATGRRLLAIAAGFASTLVLILSREGMLQGHVSWWLVLSLLVPMLYTLYNAFAGRAWPEKADTLKAGAAESLFSGLFALPLVLLLAPFGGEGSPALSGYWIMLPLVAMWVVERIAYFTLIRDKGAVYTVQATYVSTPAAVIIAAVFFGGVQDKWLWVSLALLMVALYLNNTGRVVTPEPTPQSA